jgi:hypothetical protein
MLSLPFCASFADTIHLKNGRTLAADVVKENGERVEYDIGDDTYAIPKASVDYIERGVGTPASARSGAAARIAAPKIDMAKLSQVAPDGKLTPEGLAQLEKSGDKHQLASGWIVLALQEQAAGKSDDARAHMERAVDLAPDDGDVAAAYAWLLLKNERASVAQGYAEDAVRKDPDSGFAHKILGLACYQNDRLQEAQQEFQRAKDLDPNDPEVEDYLKATKRQAKAEADFRTDASTHFNMRYEGEAVSPQLREQILNALERHFDDLVSTMGLLPRDPIVVVLYTKQTYFDVTQAPAWTAALNDGKLRIPIEGLASVTPDLNRVLKHELAHSFIRQATGGRCPVWLNEGLAQLVEPKSASQYRAQLASIFQNGTQEPLQSLESSFIGYDRQRAAVAYIESLAYVEYIRDTYGINRVNDILRDLNEGQPPEAALKSVLHDDYPQLEEEFARHLR